MMSEESYEIHSTVGKRAKRMPDATDETTLSITLNVPTPNPPHN